MCEEQVTKDETITKLQRSLTDLSEKVNILTVHKLTNKYSRKNFPLMHGVEENKDGNKDVVWVNINTENPGLGKVN